MIIDAMDLLHTDKFDGFCLVSSDSDFTRLATRIREAGLVVYGFGEEKRRNPSAGPAICSFSRRTFASPLKKSPRERAGYALTQSPRNPRTS